MPKNGQTYFKNLLIILSKLSDGAFFEHNTAQKMKFSIKDFFSKCDQIRRKLLYLLKKYLKLDSHLPKNIYFICFDESSLNMMKNAFYFILKALLVLKILNFCLDFLLM